MHRHRLDAAARSKSRCLSGEPSIRLVSLGRRSCWGMVPVIGALALSSPARSQTSGFTIFPNVSVTQTWTDNYALASANPAIDNVTRLSAGVDLRIPTGPVQGHLDYSLSSLVYAHHSNNNELQNSLNARFNAAWLEGRAGLGIDASISRGAVSAFGVQPGVNGLTQENSVELRTLALTPQFQGPIGNTLRYSAKLGYSLSDASGTSVGDSRISSVALQLAPSTPARLGWTLDGSHARSDFKVGRATTSDRLYAGLTLGLAEFDLQLSANGGVELSDLSFSQRQRYQTWGFRAAWVPSPRTGLTATIDQRPTGKTYTVALEHRTPLTAWTLSDSRSLLVDSSPVTAGGRGTAYDAFYALFASAIPDPVERSTFVVNYLRQQGISSAVSPGFLSSAASVTHLQALSTAWRGQRSTAMLSVTRSVSRRVDSASNAVDDLSAAGQVKLIGASLDLSHRLTPLSSLTLVLSGSQGRGTLVNQFNRQRQAGLQYSFRPTVASSLILGLRRTNYENSINPYGESAIFATIGLRF